MSPILVRPVREQLEHDRIIRLLPARYRRKFEVGINPGTEQAASVGVGGNVVFPDAVLYSTERGKKVLGVIEVETGESVNHLEAMSQWAHLGSLKVPFHLYVPSPALDVARRLAHDYNVTLAELWTYDHVGDQVRFTLIQKAPEPASRPAAARRTPPRPASRSAAAAPRAKTKRPAAASRASGAAARRTTKARPATKRPAKRAAAAVKKTAARKSRPAQKRR